MPHLPPEDLPNVGLEPVSLRSPESARRFFTTGITWGALALSVSPGGKCDFAGRLSPSFPTRGRLLKLSLALQGCCSLPLVYIPFKVAFTSAKSSCDDFPGGSVSKDSACDAGDPGSIPGSGRAPGEGNGKPTPVSLPGKSHGQRSLVGCSPLGRKE